MASKNKNLKRVSTYKTLKNSLINTEQKARTF